MTQDQILPSSASMFSPEKPKQHRVFNNAQLVIRILVPLFILIAVVIMFKSGENVEFGGTGFGSTLSARYYYSAAMRFQVVAEIIVGGFCLLSLIYVYLFTRPSWNINNYFYIFLHDLVLLLLLTSACGAGTTVGMIALHGERKIFWGAICNQFSKFCHKVTLALIFSYLALFLMLALTILTASRL